MPVLSVAIHGPLLHTYAQNNGEKIRCLQTGVTKNTVRRAQPLRYAMKAYGTVLASWFLTFSQPAGNSPLQNHENIPKRLRNAGRDHASMSVTKTLSLAISKSFKTPDN